MGAFQPHFIAKGDISPSRFVKIDPANGFSVLVCGDNERNFGISQEGTKASPIPGASALAAAAGDQLQIYNDGDICLLTLGGTVAAADDLKSDATGKGVVRATTGTTNQLVGAVALEAGVLDEKIRVQVKYYSIRPA